MTPTYVEGIPWPQGDPEALRAIAKHASRLALELLLDHVVVDGADWKGAAQDAWAIQVADHAHAAQAGAKAMLAAGDALTVLAAAVEAGQHAVRTAAADVAKVRDTATAVADRAHALREAADQQTAITTILAAGTRTAATPTAPPSAEELAARQAEADALKARLAALDLEAERRKIGQAAFDEVQRADRACAAKLDALHLLLPPGSSSLSGNVSALTVLGSVLLGNGAESESSLKALLTKPPPLPETVKMPKKKHFWQLAGLTAMALALTAINAVQLGLDPATDAFEAAALAEEARWIYDAMEAGSTVDDLSYEHALEKAKKRAEQLAEAGAPPAVSAAAAAAADALILEQRGDIDGPLRPADGNANSREQGADYVDANGNLWRHEIALSTPGQFDAAKYVDKLQRNDLAQNQGVILNYEELTSDQLTALLHEIDAHGARSQFRFIPPL